VLQHNRVTFTTHNCNLAHTPSWQHTCFAWDCCVGLRVHQQACLATCPDKMPTKATPAEAQHVAQVVHDLGCKAAAPREITWPAVRVHGEPCLAGCAAAVLRQDTLTMQHPPHQTSLCTQQSGCMSQHHTQHHPPLLPCVMPAISTTLAASTPDSACHQVHRGAFMADHVYVPARRLTATAALPAWQGRTLPTPPHPTCLTSWSSQTAGRVTMPCTGVEVP
jgi:hypothetical protein